MGKSGKTRRDVRGDAMKMLVNLGYSRIEEDFTLFDPLGDGSIRATAHLAAFDAEDPVILFLAVEEGQSSKPSVQDDAKFKAGLGAAEGRPFRFVWVSDGENDFRFDVGKDAQIPELPAVADWRSVARPISDTRSRIFQAVSAEYHHGDFRAVQRKFDELHEAIYSRGGIKPTNAAIDELGKLLFLKVHSEKNPNYTVRSGVGKGKRFSDLFSSEHIRANGKVAITELKDAFREINNLPQYKARDVTGEEHTIFSYDEPLRLENPEVLAIAVDALNLRDREGQPIRISVSDRELLGSGEQARMKRAHLIHEDLLGWAFDVFLRGKYASDEGLATYLTPSQVVECMAQIAFHDISETDLWARRGDRDQVERWRPDTEEQAGLPAFLCGDVCCGTGRFLIGALRQVKKRILDDRHVGHSDEDRLRWLSLMKRSLLSGIGLA